MGSSSESMPAADALRAAGEQGRHVLPIAQVCAPPLVEHVWLLELLLPLAPARLGPERVRAHPSVVHSLLVA